MIFGDRLRAAASAEPAAWIGPALAAERWTVGGLVPKHYQRYLLIEAAPAGAEDWWGEQRQIVSALAEVLTDFTGTPTQSWFAIWEGHGFDGRRVEIEERQMALHAEDARDTLSVRAALGSVPRFELPHRRYYLLAGHVGDVANIEWPGEPGQWFRPDLWWPEGHEWFLGTDVDFWCNYVGGSEAMADAVRARLPGLCHDAAPEEALRLED